MSALHEALRAWADHLHLCAEQFARAHDAENPDLPPYEWRRNLSANEERVIEAAISAGIWKEPEA